MANWEDFLGNNSAASQLLIYGVGYEVIRGLLGPAFTQIEYDINKGHPIVEISPEILADMVNRGIIKEKSAAGERAKKFGIDTPTFDELVSSAGEPPGLVQVLEWWRRGFIEWDDGKIDTPTVINAIRTGRIYTYWTDAIRQAQFLPPSVAEAVDAVLRNQIPLDEGIALAYYAGLGVKGTNLPEGTDTSATEKAFQILLDTAGRPPAPTQLAELVHRGTIPIHGRGADALTFEQGIYEGDLKDKWEKPLEAFLTVIPSIYEVRILQEHGAIDSAQATEWLNMAGYPSGVAEAISADATQQTIITDKLVTKSTILDLYQTKFLTTSQATEFLTSLGYSKQSVSFLLAAADLTYALSALKSAVTRIGSYYIARKITSDEANASLLRLDLTPDQITELLRTWDIERTSNIKLPTESQIADAWEYQIIDQATAQAKLEALGYTPYDAWMVLSVKNKAPLPNPPSQTTSALLPGG